MEFREIPAPGGAERLTGRLHSAIIRRLSGSMGASLIQSSTMSSTAMAEFGMARPPAPGDGGDPQQARQSRRPGVCQAARGGVQGVGAVPVDRLGRRAGPRDSHSGMYLRADGPGHGPDRQRDRAVDRAFGRPAESAGGRPWRRPRRPSAGRSVPAPASGPRSPIPAPASPRPGRPERPAAAHPRPVVASPIHSRPGPSHQSSQPAPAPARAGPLARRPADGANSAVPARACGRGWYGPCTSRWPRRRYPSARSSTSLPRSFWTSLIAASIAGLLSCYRRPAETLPRRPLGQCSDRGSTRKPDEPKIGCVPGIPWYPQTLIVNLRAGPAKPRPCEAP